MDLEKLFYAVAIIISMFLLSIGGFALVKTISSNGEVDYCYIETVGFPDAPPAFRLIGHVPWRHDKSFGAYSSVDDAKSKADVLSCKLGVK